MPEYSRRSPGPTYDLLQMPEQQRWQYLNDYLRRNKDGYSGLPGLHASTHKGGTDDIAGTTTPSTIEFDAEGDVGTSSSGFAPIDHVHPVSDDLAGLEDLSDLTTDAVYGAAVSDVKVRRLLEEILLESMELEEALRSLAVEEDEVLVTALPQFSVASSTSEQLLLQANANRRGYVIHNDGSQVLFIKFGTGASTSSFTYKVAAGGTLESPAHPHYIGPMYCVWDTANGSARVTELVES